MFCFRFDMADSSDPFAHPPGSITPEEIEALREALRRNPIRYPPLHYPPTPGATFEDRLP